MGGRTGYPLNLVVGDLRKLSPEKKALGQAISNQKPEKIASSTLNMFQKSKKALSFLSASLDMHDIFQPDERKNVEPRHEQRSATRFWNDLKKKKHINTTPEIDYLIIKTATRVLRHKKKRGAK